MHAALLRSTLAVATCLAVFIAPATATIIEPINYADDLAGGLVTVHFSSIFSGTPLEIGSVTMTLIGTPLTHTASTPYHPNFGFIVSGETSSAIWEIDNFSPVVDDPLAVYISKVEIDLRPSRGGVQPSLFDDGSTPSTPLSGTGVAGVIPIIISTGAAPSSAVESLPWTDPSNLGDMYGKLTLTWSGTDMLAPEKNFKWFDDTDLVPEPSSFALLGAGLAGFAFAARRCRQRAAHSAAIDRRERR
ncbi:MAG: PEP-CTERM sorting domain-containing protein [Pirellulales bacterium]|nr:PEP-CTERM sorting domain-containing protein [Pirellulales bacterium]